MVRRGWTVSVCAAVAVAAGAGAAQLGLGYGLNIVSWAPDTDQSASRAIWMTSLTWVAWLAAISTALGAIAGDRISSSTQCAGDSTLLRTVWKLVVSLSAAVGSLLIVPLVALPARLAPQVNNAVPQFAVGGYAIVGILVGVVVAVGALHVRAIAVNAVLSASWLWLLAVASVAYDLRSPTESAVAQLATWHLVAEQGLPDMIDIPGALLMLAAALVVGASSAWSAGRRGDHRVGVALSGATGPLLVASAYLSALPGVSGSLRQLSASVIAPYAIIAGLTGSFLALALSQKGGHRSGSP